MLVVRGLTKQFVRDGEARVLFRDLSFDLPRDGRMAVLGRNGQGKSTLIKILGGVLWPTSGEVKWTMTASWPLGFGGGFQGGMTGYDNINFLARIYRRDARTLIDRVDRFAELGEALSMPVKYYSTGMRARLAFGLSIAIEFDCYLIDEIIAVGDAVFRHKSEQELFVHRADRAFIVASHDLEFVRKHCSSAIIVEGGRAKLFREIDLALEIYAALCEQHEAAEAQRADSVAA